MMRREAWISNALWLQLIVFIFISRVDSFVVPSLGVGFHGVKYTLSSPSSLPMAVVEVAMPALSSTMKEGKIVAWNKQVGDKVEVGDVLMVVESDKADMDVEAFEEGYLAKIITPDGGTQTVGASVALLASSLDEIASIAAGDGITTSASTPVAPAAPVAPAGDSGDGFGTIVDMPALSSTMKEGKIVSWNKQVGDKVEVGDVLMVVESDKADMDVEAFSDGFLAKIITPEGGSQDVGAPVAILVDSKDDISKAAIGGSVPSASPVLATETTIDAVTSNSASPSVPEGGRIIASGWAKQVAASKGIDLGTVVSSRPDGLITEKDLTGATTGVLPQTSSWTPGPGVINATPKARKAALENGLDITKIKGTGNFNRVTEDDVLIAAGKKSPPAPAPAPSPSTAPATTAKPAPSKVDNEVSGPVEGVVAMTAMQKGVAKNMEKTMGAPVFRVTREIVTDDFDALYAELKPKGVTVSSLLAKAVAETLKKHPIMNAMYVEGGIKYSTDINVAMAVAIDGGLITPTITKSQDQDLFSINTKWKELVGKARSGKLSPEEYNSGTFFISNLGMFGVHQFDAILPHGAGTILSIAGSRPKVVQQKNGYFGVQKSMMVTVTCDHRHIYGADAAEFLKDLADLLENKAYSLTMG